MSGVAFEFDWEDPAGARRSELRATWARLRILVAGQPVTRLVDHRSRGVRDAIHLPLYPLAEWIAVHWWFLAYEPEVPGRPTSATYAKRHSIRAAGEGFALPDLRIQPLGSTVRLDWRRAGLQAQRVEFTASGFAVLDASAFQDEASRFVGAVVRRLEESDLRGTLLQDAWSAVQAADAEETAFCRAAASLGVDPYVVDDATREAVVAADAGLPRSVVADFFDAADLARLPRQVELVANAVRLAESHQRDRQSLLELRDRVAYDLPAHPGGAAPWRHGHDLASRVRSVLGLDGEPLRTSDALASALQADGELSLWLGRSAPSEASHAFDAVMAVDAQRGPGFVVSARRPEAQRFAVCRALYEFLATSQDLPRLITRARTAPQQRNRAFAAEFLAPIAALRGRISGPEIADEEVDDLADEFGVSPLVVRYQLENHEAARVGVDREQPAMGATGV